MNEKVIEQIRDAKSYDTIIQDEDPNLEGKNMVAIPVLPEDDPLLQKYKELKKMRKKVILVAPPHWYRTRTHTEPESTSLGLMYIASLLREQYDVQIYDAEFHGDTPTSLAVRLKEWNPDIIGFTSTLLTYHTMQDCIKRVREYLPNAKVVIGGPQVSSLPREQVEALDFDLCFLGECEGNVLQEFEQTGIVQGRPIDGLDAIPLPSRDLLIENSITQYKGNEPRYKMPETSMLWSRGCPHHCIFCGNSVFGKRPIRYRTPENIVAELKVLHEQYGIKSVFVYDDELIGQSRYQTKWLRSVLELIIEEGLHKKFSFKCQARCNPKAFGLEDLKLMRKAGFRAAMWGIESGSPKVLEAIKKGITVDDVKTIFKWCKQAKLKTYAFMMVGSWSETPEDVEMSKQLMREIKPDFTQWTVCTPMYPTEFREMVADKMVEMGDEPSYFYGVQTSTDTMTREEIFAIYNNLRRDTLMQSYLNKRRLLKYAYESIFTKRGRRVFRYRVGKYLRFRKEGRL
jgi:radical SAM superfamily enzyme YgiQ (UPF0313 family)